MNLDDISPEIMARAKECKTPEEILALANEAGYKLSDEQLEAVSGGDKTDCYWVACPDYVCDVYGCPED